MREDVLIYLDEKDPHLTRMIGWIDSLEELLEEIRASGQDQELEDQLSKIVNRLTLELGTRFLLAIDSFDNG